MEWKWLIMQSHTDWANFNEFVYLKSIKMMLESRHWNTEYGHLEITKSSQHSSISLVMGFVYVGRII